MWKKIKALWAIRKEIKTMKVSEIKTSEGRMTLLLNVIGIYSAIQGFLPPDLVAKVAAFSVAAYAVARALVKAGEAIAKVTATEKDDKIVAEAGSLLDAASGKVAGK